MFLSSPAFQDRKPIPTIYAHRGVVGGQNISIPLEWSDAPPETRSFALSIVDPHPVAHYWVHWLVIDIPKNAGGFTRGASGNRMPKGSRELYNSYGESGFGGPEPPKGSGPHPYEVTIYALNVDDLGLGVNTTLSAFQKSLEGKIIASAKITGIYER